AEAILIGRVEIEVAIAVAIAAAMRRRQDRAEAVVRDRLFPGPPPWRHAGGGRGGLDRAGIRLHNSHIAAANEAVGPVVEIVAIELVDAHAVRAAGNKGVENLVVKK